MVKSSDDKAKKSLISGLCAKCKKWTSLIGMGTVVMCLVCDHTATVTPILPAEQIIHATDLSEGRTFTSSAIAIANLKYISGKN
ncbi:MAG: hypothetical protein K0R52_1301 [Alphaproteobacteria bacterium]|jgi:hypothetical protein|nr:hypothetical protein [Alphaproteobacteria bacterium]